MFVLLLLFLGAFYILDIIYQFQYISDGGLQVNVQKAIFKIVNLNPCELSASHEPRTTLGIVAYITET